MLERQWWKEAVVYQIYPRSFQDSNNDGIGDIRGIINRLDYIKELGVDVIWLCPVYDSPGDDNGYDISDYRYILPVFGTMADFKELLDGIHSREMKLMMDLVVNHTSDEHEWFLKSIKGTDSKYRDYYIWKKGGDGLPPNNWVSFFAGSAWKYDEKSDEYYLHLFSKKQPDLNWENPAVRKEIYEMMNWWLDKGVDGFRMDVVNLISKAPGLPSVGDPNIPAWGGTYFMNGPRIHEFLKEMNSEVLAGRDIITVGEMPGVTVDEAKHYTSEKEQELGMVFQFDLMGCESYSGGTNEKWDLLKVKEIVQHWQQGLYEKGWNSNYLGNHDQPRAVSRFGNDHAYHRESATMLALFNYTLSGTPYLYQGEEIGMTNVRFDSIDDYNDIDMINHYNELVAGGWRPEDAFEHYVPRTRDNARTPMQWSAESGAGFTSGKPWLKINPNHRTINVENQCDNPDSVLDFYKRMIAMRKDNLPLIYGSFELLAEENKQVFSYIKKAEDKSCLVVLNFSDREVQFEEKTLLRYGKTTFSNYKDTLYKDGTLNLRPFEAIILEEEMHV